MYYYSDSNAQNDTPPLAGANIHSGISLNTMLNTLQTKTTFVPSLPQSTQFFSRSPPADNSDLGPKQKKHNHTDRLTARDTEIIADFQDPVVVPLEHSATVMQPPQTPNGHSLSNSSLISKSTYPSSVVGTSPISAPSNESKKRKLRTESEEIAPVIDEQASKSQAALDALQGLIDNIFEADDDNELDTSGVRSELSAVWVIDSPADEPVLCNEYQIRIDGMLRRAINMSMYAKISVDDILRLQKICLRSIRLANRIEWKGRDGFEESDESAVFRDIAIADNALKTAKTIFRTMLGFREEKQIFSEDLVKEILVFLSAIIDNLINPLIPPMPDIDRLQPYKKLILGLLQEAIRVIALVYQLLEEQDIGETVITRFEFVCINVIFAESPTSSKDSFLGTTHIENLRVAAMDILAQVSI